MPLLTSTPLRARCVTRKLCDGKLLIGPTPLGVGYEFGRILGRGLATVLDKFFAVDPTRLRPVYDDE